MRDAHALAMGTRLWFRAQSGRPATLRLGLVLLALLSACDPGDFDELTRGRDAMPNPSSAGSGAERDGGERGRDAGRDAGHDAGRTAVADAATAMMDGGETRDAAPPPAVDASMD